MSRLQAERTRWIELFDLILPRLSTGEFGDSILKAKENFFEKLGRSHERDEDRYESVSQSFLEWYLFDYKIEGLEKTPASIFLIRELGSAEELKLLERGIYNNWSLFEVTAKRSDFVELKDLLNPPPVRLLYGDNDPVSRSWKVEAGQIIQARLFPTEEADGFVCTHFWLHAPTELETLRKICQAHSKSWEPQVDLLRESLDCLLRSLSLSDQMQASRSANWIYKELSKKYAA